MKAHKVTACQFGRVMAYKRGKVHGDALTFLSLAGAFWALAETLTDDITKHRGLAQSARRGFDAMSVQNGWPTMSELADEDR